MTILDDLDSMKSNDPDDMLGHIGDLPNQIKTAWATIASFEPPVAYREVRNVTISGMGGSAIGGSLVQALAEPECPIPIAVNRDYDLPGYVDENTLVIASSYSGNTEETLSALDQALNAGAKIIALTTNGKLAKIAADQGFPTVSFDYDAQPRAALGYSFTLLLGIFVKLSLLGDQTSNINEAIDTLRRMQTTIGEDIPSERNPAKDLAIQSTGKTPTIYGAGIMKPVAQRWKGQFNENAKTWAAFDEMPELNHNSVVGYEGPEHLKDSAFVVMLQSSIEGERIHQRFDVTASLLSQARISHAVVKAWGESPLTQMLSAIHLGDYVSYYRAAINGVDPTPIPSIDHLKQELG